MALLNVRKRRWHIVGGVALLVLLGRIGHKIFFPTSTNQLERISAIQFSPETRTVAVGNYSNKALKLYDPKSGKLMRELNGRLPSGPGTIRSLSFSPDGKSLACGYMNDGGTGINIFDSKTGEVNQFIDTYTLLLEYSRDGKYLASCGYEDQNEKEPLWPVISIFDSNTGEVIKKLHPSTLGSVESMSISPDGRSIVTAIIGMDIKTNKHTDGEIISCWHVAAAKVRWSVKEAGAKAQWSVDEIGIAACSAQYSPAGNSVANAVGNVIHLRSAKTGELIRSINLSGQPDYLACAIAFSPDGRMLLVGDSDDNISLWDVQRGGLVKKMHRSSGTLSGISSVKWSADGKLIASANWDNNVEIRDSQSLEVISTLGLPYRRSRFY